MILGTEHNQTSIIPHTHVLEAMLQIYIREHMPKRYTSSVLSSIKVTCFPMMLLKVDVCFL